MNWLEPANTVADMSCPCQRAIGPAATRAPKMMPNGAAPTIIGTVSRAPAARLESGVSSAMAARLGIIASETILTANGKMLSLLSQYQAKTR